MNLCENCHFWSPDLSALAAITVKEGWGECRRRAPRGPVFYDSASKTTVLNAFVVTAGDDWCGEHEEKP